MHELHATQAILETALRNAEDAGATCVTDLLIVNGEETTYSDDSIRFYWETLSQFTVCEGAKLTFKHVPGKDFRLESIEIERFG
jgi:hydrogenase nickel incorporation protein HypA/HybF